jgi:phage shock protein PspC (stress-responsive transcriptional regulator)
MIKTISINLSGQVLQIDENAYEQLKQYLSSVRKRFENEEGSEEIVADIEGRIAEMFAEKISSRKQSITLADVDAVIKIMGKPEQFDDVYAEENPSSEKEKNTSEKRKRRMFRNPDDKVVGGVCSGLSNYFGIDDPLWLRVIMVTFLFISFGTAFWIYVILWIIIPEAKTASDKLQMKGEPVNIHNIEKTFKDDLKDFQHKIENISNNERGSFRAGLQKILAVAGALLRLFAKALSKSAAFFIVIAGVVFSIILLFGLVLPVGILGVSFPVLFNLVFENNSLMFLAGLGLFLFLAVPAFSLIYIGIRMLLGIKTRSKTVGLSLTGLWVLGIIICFYVGAVMGKSFSVKEIYRETSSFNFIQDTIVLKHLTVIEEGAEDPSVFIGFNENPLYFGKDEKTMYMPMQNLDIVKSENSETTLQIRKKARGKSRTLAGKKAQAIEYTVQHNETEILFPSHYELNIKDKYRMQEVTATLSIPEGKVIYLSAGMEKTIYDVKNTTNTFDADMIGHYWKMNPEGLTCLSCNSIENNNTVPQKSRLNYDLSGYNEIQIDGNLNVEIQQGDNYSFYIEGDNDFSKSFNAKTENNTLTIASDFKWKNIVGGSKKGTVFIITPTLNRLEINGLNNTIIKGLKTEKLTVEINGASKNSFQIDVKDFALELNGASQLDISGKTLKTKITATGASKINASKLETVSGNYKLNGASTASVWVKESLKAELDGASKIYYRGNPKIQSQTSGGASISREE